MVRIGFGAKRLLGLGIALGLVPAGAMAVVPVAYPPPALTEVTINNSAGDQTNPQVSGDWAAYTSDLGIRYYNFTTGADAAIPMGASGRDSLSDISGSRIAFSREITGVRSAIMVFDAATPAVAPLEVDPGPSTVRLGSAIGGDTVAYVDYGLQENGELVIHDLATSTSVRVTNDTAFDVDPNVSPNGNVVVWEHCPSSQTNCDIWQAVKSGTSWTVGVVADTNNPEFDPDTSGTLDVYASARILNWNVFWRPVAGGAEGHLEVSDFAYNPSIAGDFIAYERRATGGNADLFVYDVVNNRLFQITDTPLVNEQLNDIAVLPDGRLRMVWASDEDGTFQRNVRGATFELPNVAPTLSFSAEAGYGTDGVSPDSGSATTSFTYKVVYSDFNDQAPSYLHVCIDGGCHAMSVDISAAAALRDGNHRDGEQYSYSTLLAAGSHSYYFETSDGVDTARLPGTGTLSGPSVSGQPPVLTVPGTITVNATSPAGAVVTFSVTATGGATVVCTPASGSTFSVGTTTVSCTATNSGGQATASFNVVVNGAAAQIMSLLALVESFNLQHGIENSLDVKLQHVLDAVNAAGAGDMTTACNKLNAFINQVQAQSGNAMTPAQAGQLVGAANQVKAAVGCP